MLFYTQLFTSKRGTLAKIWLAAHWERKLTKAHVFECNLEASIQDIISPKMKIGLRTSGHLLLGVVRIYSRKAKYLFADCNDALLQMKLAFRPGQTDMPVEGLEATLAAITLMEDFTAFDAQLPPLSNIDVVDHFSLNQGRSEEITLKEDYGRDTLTLENIGRNATGQNSLLEMNFHSLTEQGDAFGDEDRVFDILDFLTNSSDHIESTNFLSDEPHNETQNSTLNYQQDVDSRDPVEGETSALNETSLLNNEEAFALEPVTTTPTSQKKREKRKRKLVVDENKEQSNRFLRQQLSDYSDLIAPLDMAPPTVQLMQWKESGGADKLFTQTCSTVVNPQMKELFAQSLLLVKGFDCEEVEEMRQETHEALPPVVQQDLCSLPSSVDSEKADNTELTVLDHVNNNLHEDCSNHSQVHESISGDQNMSEFFHPKLPSEEDSMFVHPSPVQQETQATSLRTQSVPDSQDFEERRISRRAHALLNCLKSSSDTTLSLQALCEGGNRSQAAITFFCLLVLKKEQALHLHQSAPYKDILVTPGSKFHDF